MVGYSRVEAGPVHPQEEGAWPEQTGPVEPGEGALDGPDGARTDMLSFSSGDIKWLTHPSHFPPLELYSCWGLILEGPPCLTHYLMPS